MNETTKNRFLQILFPAALVLLFLLFFLQPGGKTASLLSIGLMVVTVLTLLAIAVLLILIFRDYAGRGDMKGAFGVFMTFLVFSILILFLMVFMSTSLAATTIFLAP